MTDKTSFDAVFVGGGIIGLSCAWCAARRGARVAVLERAQPPAGATNVAAGMLAPVGELSFGEPQLLEMTLAAARLYPEFVAAVEAAASGAGDGAAADAGYRRQGALHVALDSDEAAQLRRVHELQRSLQLEAEWLAPRRCRELEPGLTPSFHGGVFAPGEASVDPRALSRALLAALDAAGAEVRTGCEVVGGVFEGERLRGVEVAAAGTGGAASVGSGPSGGRGEALRAGAVVLANGAWSGAADWLPEKARPPVRPVKGEVLELRTRDGEEPPAPPSQSAASRPRSAPAACWSCCARPTGCSPTSPRWSCSARSPACAPALPTTCRSSAAARSTASSSRPATSATASCSPRSPPTPSPPPSPATPSPPRSAPPTPRAQPSLTPPTRGLCGL